MIQAASDVTDWFTRMDCLVVGPGLGQEPVNQKCALEIIRSAQSKELSMIVDADALRLLTQDTSLLKGCVTSIVTPNFNELHRLASEHGIPHDKLSFPNTAARIETAISLARKLEGPVVLSKGPVDVITDGNVVVECSEKSSPRRCGGQGDILAGCAAVMLSWAQKSRGWTYPASLSRAVVAAYGASCITRMSSSLAFSKMGRSMICSDMIPHLVTGLSSLEI